MSGWYESGSLFVRTTINSSSETVPPRLVILWASLQMLFIHACIDCVLCFSAWYNWQHNASWVVHPHDPRVVLKFSQIITGSSNAWMMCMTSAVTHSAISTHAFLHPSSHLLNSSFSIITSHSPVFCTYFHSPSCTRSCCIRNSNVSQLLCVSLSNWYLGSPLLLAIIVCCYRSLICHQLLACQLLDTASNQCALDGRLQCTLSGWLLMCPPWVTSNAQCALPGWLPMCPQQAASDVPSLSDFWCTLDRWLLMCPWQATSDCVLGGWLLIWAGASRNLVQLPWSEPVQVRAHNLRKY